MQDNAKEKLPSQVAADPATLDKLEIKLFPLSSLLKRFANVS